MRNYVIDTSIGPADAGVAAAGFGVATVVAFWISVESPTTR
jgi:hypothetical protein